MVEVAVADGDHVGGVLHQPPDAAQLEQPVQRVGHQQRYQAEAQQVEGAVAPGGPGWAPVAQALGRVLGTGRVVALGVGCTWHPGLGAGEQVRGALAPVLASWA